MPAAGRTHNRGFVAYTVQCTKDGMQLSAVLDDDSRLRTRTDLNGFSVTSQDP
jgi:hypothetical protein